MKKCSKCHKEKPLSDFHLATKEKDGHKSACRECCNSANRAYKVKNKDAIKAYAKAYQPRANELSRAWYKENKDKAKARLAKKPPEYRIWTHLRERCNNPKATGFRYYGGRGISVCDRWDSFAKFLKDMGERPTTKHQIDRIDCNGNYEPSNCRWATASENQRNKRYQKITPLIASSIRYQHNFGGVSQRELAMDFNLSYGYVNDIIKNRRWVGNRSLNEELI